MANGITIIIGFVVIVVMSAAAYFLSPKGENQTVWRSSLILTFVACYLMWAITLIAQIHPLIAPRRSDLRPEADIKSVRFAM